MSSPQRTRIRSDREQAQLDSQPRGPAALQGTHGACVRRWAGAALRGAWASAVAVALATGLEVLPWALPLTWEGASSPGALVATWGWLGGHVALLLGPTLAIPIALELLRGAHVPRALSLAGSGLLGAGAAATVWRALCQSPPFATSAALLWAALGLGLGLGALYWLSLGQSAAPRRVAGGLGVAGWVTVVFVPQPWAEPYPTLGLATFLVGVYLLQLSIAASVAARRGFVTRAMGVALSCSLVGLSTAAAFIEPPSPALRAQLRRHAEPARAILNELSPGPYGFICRPKRSARSASAEDPIGEFLQRTALPGNLRGPTNYDLLLVSVESFRPDLTTVTRTPRDQVAPLLAWSRRGLWFARAYAPAPSTLHSMAALFTLRVASRAPLLLDTDRAWRGELRPGAVTLAREFRAAGAQAFANVHGTELGQSIRGLEQGFEPFWVYPKAKAAAELDMDTTLVDRTLASLDALATGQRFFGWLFLGSTHAPWRVGAPQTRRFARTPAAYLDELMRVERALARLLEGLESRERLRNTVVLIHGDHGESLGERDGLLGHGQRLYWRHTRTVALLLHPDLQPGLIAEPTSLLSVVASAVLGRADAPGRFARQQVARELLPMLDVTGDRVMVERLHAAEPGVALLAGRDEWIHGYASLASELFDLERDPAERQNLWQSSPRRRAAALRAFSRYANWRGCQGVVRFR